jgi:FMN phosphatase YigB (HAD superfamily)
MRIYLDFDDVLFNTQAFLEKLKSIFETYGVSRELFEQTYQAMKAESLGSGFCYSFEAHMDQLRPHGTFDEENLGKERERAIADTAEFLFPDVRDFLAALKEKGYQISILSFGDQSFQEKKINGTGIAEYVAKNIVTDKDKAEALQDEGIGTAEEVWFFDDRVHFIESVKRAFPTIKTVLVRRPEGRFSDKPSEWCDYTVADLLEGGKIIIDS